MVIVIPVVSYIYYRNQKDKSQANKTSILNIFPFFIFGFIGMGILRTIGDYGIENTNYAFMLFEISVWEQIIDLIKTSAEYLLAIAMAAVGLSTNISSLKPRFKATLCRANNSCKHWDIKHRVNLFNKYFRNNNLIFNPVVIYSNNSNFLNFKIGEKCV